MQLPSRDARLHAAAAARRRAPRRVHFNVLFERLFVCRLGLPRVLEYSLLSISGCKFPFPVAVFCSQLVDELLKFSKTWGFAISFATFQSGNRSDYIHV